MPARAVFVDRDGVLNRWIRGGYALAERDVVFNDAAIEALAAVDRTEFAVIVASNQSCVGRGLLSAAELTGLMTHVVTQAERRGLALDAWYCCPHAPEEGCACRKPAPGLLAAAAAEHGLDLDRSFFIGDQPTDMEAADRAGVCGLMVRPDDADDVRAAVTRVARAVRGPHAAAGERAAPRHGAAGVEEHRVRRVDRTRMHTDVAELARAAMVFRDELRRTKAQLQPSSFWYPYDSLGNFTHFEALLDGANRGAFDDFRGLTIADIGAADGDTSFFLESLGNSVDIIDYGPTNFNGLRGAAEIKRYLGSSVTIQDVDLDAQFTLPRERYDVAFFLGILYHLKNPFYILETLARRVDRCFLSTKVAKLTRPGGMNIEAVPLAYLLDTHEANDDPTNFWVFTMAGLMRLLDRTGWDVLAHVTVGNTTASDPATPAGDERAFCYLRSRARAVSR